MQLRSLIPAFLGLALTLAGCSSFSSRSTSAAAPHQPLLDYAVTQDVIFTPAGWPRPLPATMYVPDGPGPFPAVLLLYGGAWSQKDHRWQMAIIARKLARRGYVVMSATYRGVPTDRYPAAYDDVRQALTWLRANAATYHGQPGRIGVYGYSAGAHLAALLGTINRPTVQAVVAGGTPADLTYHPGGDLVPAFLGGTYDQIPAIFREASPVFHVAAGDPPFFLYYGTNDQLVDPENTRLLKAALDRAGVPCEVFPLEGKGHMATLIWGGAAEDAALDFFDRTLRKP